MTATLALNPVYTRLKCCIQDYFRTLNAGNYYETSLLFAESGELQPPLDDVVQGQDAIAHYLHQEASGMTFNPHDIEVQGTGQAIARGSVQTPWFRVNVVWDFRFNAQQQIMKVQVKLLASPQELLNFQQFMPAS